MVLSSCRGRTGGKMGGPLLIKHKNKQSMKQLFVNRLDCLEIAFERNQQFENTLAFMGIAKHPLSIEELAEKWLEDQYDIPGLNHQTKATTEQQTLLDDFTIGQWHFQRGVFAGRNSAYKYNFKITRTDTEIHCDTDEFGYLYFETYLLKRDKVYLKVSNKLLYDEESLWSSIRAFQKDFDLTFSHVSKVDLAVDGFIDVSQYIYQRMKRNPEIDWVINGKAITDRNASINKLFFVVNGSLNNPDKNKNLYVKQSEGLTLNCYDKTTEVVDKSHKYFQTCNFEIGDDGLYEYVEEDKIYRNEIRLTRKNIDNFMACKNLTDDQFFTMLQTQDGRNSIFDDISRRMIRWHRFGEVFGILSLVMNGKYRNNVKTA